MRLTKIDESQGNILAESLVNVSIEEPGHSTLVSSLQDSSTTGKGRSEVNN